MEAEMVGVRKDIRREEEEALVETPFMVELRSDRVRASPPS